MATANMGGEAFSKTQEEKLEAFAFVLQMQIKDLRVRLLDDIQRHMDMITCTEDIRKKQSVIKLILGIKMALEPITYQTSRQYQSPILPDLDSMEDIQNKEDVRKLCEFFQVIHFTLYEIKMKLCHVYDHLSWSVKAVPVEYLTSYALALKQIKEYSIQLEEQ